MSMKKYLLVFFKGMLMGVADLVPGISGGTIALITGIYKDLIIALNNINLKNTILLFSTISILIKRPSHFFNNKKWKDLQNLKLRFIIFLAFGIITSILFFSKIILFLLDNFDKQLSSFFFGLILCSIVVLFKRIKKFNLIDIIILIISCFIINQITHFDFFKQEISLVYIFICGFICSSAMILPGISGSYILLILGAYHFILEKLNSLFDFNDDSYLFILFFICGALIGIIIFSRIIRYLLLRNEKRTMIVLIGFIFGTITNVLPVDLNENNVFISTYNFFYYDLQTLLFALSGFLLIFILNIISNKNETF